MRAIDSLWQQLALLVKAVQLGTRSLRHVTPRICCGPCQWQLQAATQLLLQMGVQGQAKRCCCLPAAHLLLLPAGILWQ